MKIFSAQDSEHKEFSLIEFSSELSALTLINELPKEVKLIDMFSLMNGNFVVFISCNSLKKIYDSLRAHPTALGGYFTNDTNMESLQAFYYLNQPSISDAVIVVKTNKFYKLFETIDLGLKAQLQVLDIKNQRSFSTNTVYITGSLPKILEFKKQISQDSTLEYQVLEKISDSLREAFGG